MEHYEYWAHRGGEHFLVRLDDTNLVTGICGPMFQAAIPTANRHNYDYDVQPVLTAWVRTHAAEFHSIGSSPASLDTIPSEIRA
jgi:hypothetical protein